MKHARINPSNHNFEFSRPVQICSILLGLAQYPSRVHRFTAPYDRELPYVLAAVPCSTLSASDGKGTDDWSRQNIIITRWQCLHYFSADIAILNFKSNNKIRKTIPLKITSRHRLPAYT